MAVRGIHFLTFHGVVRSVAIEQRQKAVAFQVAGPVVRVCGEKHKYMCWLCVSCRMCRFSSTSQISAELPPRSHRSSSRR